jgi:hypothetical protein
MAFASPQDGLVPIGGGFYATPNTPQPPNYENPFSKQFIGIEKNIVYDQCNIGIEVTGTLGFMNLPSFQLVSRNQSPACNQPPPEYEPPEFVPGPGKNTLIGDSLGVIVIVENAHQDYTYKLNGKTERRVLICTGTIEEFKLDTSKKTLILQGNYEIPSTHTWQVSVYTYKWDTFYSPFLGETENTGIGTQTFAANVHYGVTWLESQSFTGRPCLNRVICRVIDAINVERSFEANKRDGSLEKIEYTYQYAFIGSIFPVPPPPIPDMTRDCCDETLALLRLINKKIGNLPATVPSNIAKKEPQMETIESLAELHLWQVRQLDATIGHYPIKIKIKDTDSTKEGDQGAEIIVPNLSEGIAELLGLAISTKRDTHAGLIVGIKSMTQAGMATKLAQMGLDVGLACAEFLGFELKQSVKKIPMLFTPNGKDLSDTLKEKEIEYLHYSNVDKQDLMDHLRKILEMVARWTAQNWRKVSQDNPGGSMLANLYNGIGGLDVKRKADEKEKKLDFDSFTERAENGFTNVTGITDTDHPWGNDYENRPRVREIGKDTIQDQ